MGAKFAVGIGSHVGQRGVAVAAHAGSVEALGAEGELVLDHRNAQAGAKAAELDAVVVVAGAVAGAARTATGASAVDAVAACPSTPP